MQYGRLQAIFVSQLRQSWVQHKSMLLMLYLPSIGHGVGSLAMAEAKLTKKTLAQSLHMEIRNRGKLMGALGCLS